MKKNVMNYHGWKMSVDKKENAYFYGQYSDGSYSDSQYDVPNDTFNTNKPVVDTPKSEDIPTSKSKSIRKKSKKCNKNFRMV